MIKRYLSLYKTLIKFAVIKSMAYPQDFVIWAVIDLSWSIITLSFFKVILLRTPTISGWSFDQLTIILGLVHILSAFVWGAMYGNMKELGQDINKGTLDLFLTKPANSQFLVSSRHISLNLFPSLFIGLFLTGYGLVINDKLTLINVAVCILSIISSVIFSYSMYFMTVTLAIWFSRLNNIADLFLHSIDIARYPANIFPSFFKFLFTFLIPLALVGFVPAGIILGEISYWWVVGVPTIAALFLFFSHKFWEFALQYYTSASS